MGSSDDFSVTFFSVLIPYTEPDEAYNILFIPRHWLFKFSINNKSGEIFTWHNVFSKIFSILH